jgi:ribosomal protein S24E
VKAEGIDYTGAEEVSQEELISDIEEIGNTLKSLPNEVVIDMIENENGTQQIAGKTITYENGTKEIVNKTGTYNITSDDTP